MNKSVGIPSTTDRKKAQFYVQRRSEVDELPDVGSVEIWVHKLGFEVLTKQSGEGCSKLVDECHIRDERERERAQIRWLGKEVRTRLDDEKRIEDLADSTYFV